MKQYQLTLNLIIGLVVIIVFANCGKDNNMCSCQTSNIETINVTPSKQPIENNEDYDCNPKNNKPDHSNEHSSTLLSNPLNRTLLASVY